MSEPISCLVADPAWHHRDRGIRGGTKRQYKTMPTSDICRMSLPELTDDCWLFLWCTHNHKQDAHLVAKAWGFDRYRSEGIWVKLSRKGTVRIVGGHTLRQAHESFLLFSRGKPKRNDRGVPSVLMAEGFRKPDGRILHSGKPEEFYELVERFCSGPYAEMFARRPRDGWDSYGDELPKAAE